MQYEFIDKNPAMVQAWKAVFKAEEKVTIYEGDLTTVVSDAIVSPANSFGFMDGGVDLAISLRLGWYVQTRLQTEIQNLPEGELLIGRSLTIPTDDPYIPYVIATPTMRVPMSFNIATSVNAYLATKAALIAAIRHPNIETVAFPGMCTGVGRMKPETAAHQMYQAFQEIVHGQKMKFYTFGAAQRYHWTLNEEGMIYR